SERACDVRRLRSFYQDGERDGCNRPREYRAGEYRENRSHVVREGGAGIALRRPEDRPIENADDDRLTEKRPRPRRPGASPWMRAGGDLPLRSEAPLRSIAGRSFPENGPGRKGGAGSLP